MQRIDVSAFKGMAPRVSPALLENEQGISVTGTCTSGELRPWNIPSYVQDCPADTQAIYRTAQGDWLTWDEVVNAYPAVQANDAFGRVYYTRESGGVFCVSPLDDYTEYRVGVPKPGAACTVTITGAAGGGSKRDVVYVYTYVNDWGEEGPPSDPSAMEEVETGQTITLSDFAPPVIGFKTVVTIRIYRIATGDKGADWFFVDEIPAPQIDYVDSIADIGLGDALSTSTYDLPQTNARSLVPVGNGIFATFQGNEVAFSEPYLPYAWPDGFRMTVAGFIVALGVTGASVVVLTTDNPYYIYTAHPSAARIGPESFLQSRQSEVTPCVSPRSVVSTEFGVLFAAPDGLRVMSGEGASKLATESLVTAKEWVGAFDPVNIRAGFVDGTYFGWIGQNGFAFHVRTGVLTWTGIPATAMHTDGLGLFIARDGAIYEWAAEAGLLRGEFKSKVYRFPRPVNLAAVRIDSSMDPAWGIMLDHAASVRGMNTVLTREPLDLAGEEVLGQTVAGDNLHDLPYDGGGLWSHLFRVWADGRLVFDGLIGSLGFARLPAGFLAREWQFEIRTYSHVKQISLGTSTRAMTGGR